GTTRTEAFNDKAGPFCGGCFRPRYRGSPPLVRPTGGFHPPPLQDRPRRVNTSVRSRHTLLGLGLVVAGIAFNLRAAFPSATDMRLGWGGRVLLFWGVAGLLSLALLLMLVGVTFVTLGLD